MRGYTSLNRRQIKNAAISGGSMEVDDNKRGNHGVVVSSVERDGNVIQLIFDDVESEGAKPRRWIEECLYTYRDLDRSAFDDSALSEADLAQIGFAIVSRLASRTRYR